MKCITTCSIILLAFIQIQAQIPTIHDCLGAIPICKAVYTQSSLPDGEGNYPNEINGVYDSGGWCCMDDEVNSVWYTFTANNDGNFGFILTPNDLSDDYDWALFDLTNAECEDIYDTESLNISCNAAGSNSGTDCDGVTGPDGSEIYDFQGAGCNFSTPTVSMGKNPFNNLVPVIKGNTYVLIVSNWKGQGGFTIDFSLSVNTGIIDEINPDIADIMTPENCGDDTFIVSFSENIQCATVLGNNFEIMGPGGPYTISLLPGLCDIGATYTNEFSFQISPPLSFAGNYMLNIISPTDILDLCDNPLLNGDLGSFVVEESIPVVNLGNDTILCNVSSYILDATTVGAQSYVWQDNSSGNTFNATQSGAYSVIVDFGGGCMASDEIEITFNDSGNLLDLGPDTIVCDPSIWSLTTNINNALSYLWQDGSTNASIDVSASGLYWVEVMLAGDCYERDSINVDFSTQSQSIDLGPDQQICKPGVVNLIAIAPAAISFEWQDGSINNSFNASVDGLYWVEATFSDGCTVTDSIILDFATIELIPDLGSDTTLCIGTTFLLDGTTLNAESYTWQDGSSSPVFSATTEGWYWITVNATDACPKTDSVYLSFISGTQILNLGADTIICLDQPYLLNASIPNGSSYLWEDGSVESAILIDQAGHYSVTVEANDCFNYVGSINIGVQDCRPCDFYIPNLFTPNNDGINDKFTPNISCHYTDYELFIYNRWGSLVFRSQDTSNNWNGEFNGEKAAVGVYIYFIQYTYNEEVRILSGDVSLIR